MTTQDRYELAVEFNSRYTVEQYIETIPSNWGKIEAYKAVKTYNTLEEAINAPEVVELFSYWQAKPFDLEVRRPDKFKFIKAYVLENGDIYYSYFIVDQNITMINQLTVSSYMSNSGLVDVSGCIDGFIIKRLQNNLVYKKDSNLRKHLAYKTLIDSHSTPRVKANVVIDFENA